MPKVGTDVKHLPELVGARGIAAESETGTAISKKIADRRDAVTDRDTAQSAAIQV